MQRSASAGAAAEDPRRVWPALLGGTLLLFFARAVLSLIRSGPVLVADEMGYLGNARAIVGEIGTQMELAPFYRSGYSLLIAPLLKLTADVSVQYHLVLVLNAALAAAVFPLLYLLLTRFVAVPTRVALWAAFAGSVYPAITVLSQVAMSENVLFPLICVWLICFAGLLSSVPSRSQLLWAVALGAGTGALWAVHNRLSVAIVVAFAGMAWLLYRRRLRLPAALAGVATIALFMIGVHFLDAYVVTHNYGGSAPDELTSRMHEILHLRGIGTVLANLLGQTWYLLVATFGLAAVVLAEFVRGRSRADGRAAGAPDPPRELTLVLLALSGLLLLISAAAFPERTRPDMLIYGRYAEIVAPALIAFGVAALARGRVGFRIARPALGFVALTAFLVLVRLLDSDPETAGRWNISALPFVTMQVGPAVLIGAAVIAAGGALLLGLASRRGIAALGAATVALFLAVMAYSVWNPVRSSERAIYPAGWESPQAAAGGRTIAYDLDAYETIGLYVFQWFLPDSRVLLFHGDDEAPPTRLVISGQDYGSEHPGSGAVEVWSAAGRDQALWRLRDRQAP